MRPSETGNEASISDQIRSGMPNSRTPDRTVSSTQCLIMGTYSLVGYSLHHGNAGYDDSGKGNVSIGLSARHRSKQEVGDLSGSGRGYRRAETATHANAG